MRWLLFPKKSFWKSAGWKNFYQWKIFYHSPARIVECVAEYITFNFNKQISQTKKQKNKDTKKQKKLKKKSEYLRKIDKKNICGHPGEDFSRHPHLRKQEHLFFGLIEYLQSELTVLLGICIISKNSDAHSRLLIFLPMNLSTGGGHFGQNDKKMHKNSKIKIFVSKQWGDVGEGQANFWGGWGDPPVTSCTSNTKVPTSEYPKFR